MRLLLALALVLVAGAAHADTLHLSMPRHLPPPRTRFSADAPAAPRPPHSVTFEARSPRRPRAPSTRRGLWAVPSPAWRGDQRQAIDAAAIHVHDGDTFYVGPDAIRLRGIDTPELGQPRAEEARDRLTALLHSGPVTIVRRAEDVYGRIVADVFVSGASVARILKAEGYAKPRAMQVRARRPAYRSLNIPRRQHASYLPR